LLLPPLRRRKEDIPHLATFFLQRYAKEFSVDVLAFSARAQQKLCSYDFPGNVRELQNVVQQAIVGCRRSIVCAEDLHVGDTNIVESEASPEPASEPLSPAPASSDDLSLRWDLPYNDAKQTLIDDFEQRYVKHLLDACDGNVTHAATRMGLPRKSLSRIMKRHGLGAGPDGLGGRPGRPPKASDA